MSLDVRAISDDDFDAFHRTLAVPFGIDPSPERTERLRSAFEKDRLRGAFDRGEIVGTLGALSLRLSVPGGELPAAGTTLVAVLPTHRRRGALRSLMTQHLTEVHERGECLAILWASESPIYGRFGYGPACERAAMNLPKSSARMRQHVEARGTTRLLARDEAQSLFPAIHDSVARRRPGMLRRSEQWWKNRALSDPEFARAGSTEHRRVLYERDGQSAGYCIYRTRMDWERLGAELQVLELVGVDPDAEKNLWLFVFGVDLTHSITYRMQPVDDPLRWWLDEPRRMERKIEDAIWLRPVDVAAALQGRTYSSPGSLVIAVRDSFCPWNAGVFRLEVDDHGHARYRPAKTEAEIELTSEALGMVYLGGHRFRELARAGLMTGAPDALARADAMFEWDPLPWCPDFF
jgi:predicted acetyltransferase